MIVEADDVDGTALEQVVARRRLVTARRDGACRIVALHDFSQMLRQQALHGEFTVLGQRRGIVPGVEYQVGLLQGQRISLST